MPSIVWKGHLTFGLVSIPVKLYRAARRERVRMHYVHRPEVPEEPPDEPGIVPELSVRSAGRAAQRLEAFPPTRAQEPALGPPPPVTRVHQALMTPDERPIPRGDVFSGYEVEPERYVVFDREELKGLPFAPEEFKDEYREQLQAMIAKKLEKAGTKVAREPAAAATPVVDILEALKKSIAMTRKPTASETQPARKTPGRLTQIKSQRPSRKAR